MPEQHMPTFFLHSVSYDDSTKIQPHGKVRIENFNFEKLSDHNKKN